nr:hypothetical protein [Tanacetum cinerariifolium]
MVAEDDEMIGNVAGARENVGTPIVQKSRIQCYNYKEYGHVARECQKLKRPKDAAYDKEKMLLCKQEEAGFQLNAEQADWKDDTDDESKDQELEAHYIEHPEQSKSIHNTYPIEQDEHNVIIDSLDMSYDREQIDQDDDNDLDNEHDLIASLIEKLKCEIDDSKNHNKFLETSNKVLVDKLKCEIKDFKTKNKSLESSNNRFKEANNELSKTNELMYIDLKKFQAELDRRNDVKYASKIYDQEPSMVAEDDEMSKDKEIDKLMALISLSFKKIYKSTNNNLRTSSNTSNVAGARENVGTLIVQKSRIQCYNCKEYGHVARECQKLKRPKDAAYDKEKMLLCKQEEAGFQLNAEQADWKDGTDDESKDQELEAHYIEQIDQDDDNDLDNEHDLLASLIEKLKCEIDDSKNRNKFLETSNKVLVDKLKCEIKDFKTKNKSLESSNNRFKEANNELSNTNELMYIDLKKFQAELDRRNDVKYASKVEIDCAK